MNNQDGVDRIFQLGNAWLNKVIQPDGSGHHTPESAKLMLHRNGIHFHELSINEIQACCVVLTNRLHYRNIGAYIDGDQRIFWSWIGQLFCSTGCKNLQKINDDVLDYLCGIMVPLILIRDDLLFEQRFNKSGNLTCEYDWHLHKIASRKLDILRFLAYPFLESITRSVCNAYVDQGGIIVQDFTVPQKAGKTRIYKIGKWCSNLEHLLILLESSVARAELSYFLGIIKDCITRITSNTSPYNTLYSWRNQTLHGNKFSGIAGALLFNIGILLLLETARDNYDVLRKEAINEYSNFAGRSSVPKMIYYRPNGP